MDINDTAVKLAKDSLKTYLKEKKKISPLPEIKEYFLKRAGAFVSIEKKDGALRGCIGTIEPVHQNLAEEIINNAISAGVKDPRFLPVELSELDDLYFTVDVLHPMEEVKSLDELDPKNYGVIIIQNGKKGVLLPDLEGIDTPQKQIEIAASKAGINDVESSKIYRFKVERYHE